MEQARGAILRLQAALALWLDRLAGWPTVFTAVLLPVAAALAFKGNWVGFVVGAVLLVVNAVLLWAQKWWADQNRDAEVSEGQRLRVAMKDALQPVAALIAAMPYQDLEQRRAQLKVVATQTVSALVVLMPDVDRLRAVVFALTPDHQAMHQMAYFGRGSAPSPFEAGTVRGDRALALVEQRGDALFVEDLDQERPEEWEGSGSDYKTFISTPISNGEFAYGMLTVDAPLAGDLGSSDVDTVMLLADLLAIAFAEAERRAADAGPADE